MSRGDRAAALTNPFGRFVGPPDGAQRPVELEFHSNAVVDGSANPRCLLR
jgi:hypothetical protein